MKQMAVSLAEQISFPDLEGWEDSSEKVAAAKRSVSSLKQYLAAQKQTAEEQRERDATRKLSRERMAEALSKAQSLEKMKDTLAQLSKRLGTQEAGYAFQTWFYDLVEFFEVTHRRPYVVSSR